MTLWQTRQILATRSVVEVPMGSHRNRFGFIPPRADTQAGEVQFTRGPLEIVYYSEKGNGCLDLFLIGFPDYPGHFGLFRWENEPDDGPVEKFWGELVKGKDSAFAAWFRGKGLAKAGCLDFAVRVFTHHPLMRRR